VGKAVLVVCHLKRPAGSKIEVGGKTYHFKPEEKEHGKDPKNWPVEADHVCLIEDEKALKRLAAAAMNGAYTVPGYSPEPEKQAELKMTEAETAETLDKAIADVGAKLIDDGEYVGREDYVAAQMASFYGADKNDILKKLEVSKKNASAEKARKEADKKGGKAAKQPT
jgi:hypothetical protein